MFTSIFKILCDPGLFRTMVYSEQEGYPEPWYIQRPGIFRPLVYSEPCYIQNPGIFRTQKYSETCQTSTMECFHENS